MSLLDVNSVATNAMQNVDIPESLKEFYTEEGEPIKCINCGATAIKTKTMGWEANVVSEVQYFCGSCEEIIAYWAYGYFDPSYLPDFKETP